MKTTQFNFSKIVSTAKYLGVAGLFIAGLATFSGCATKGCTDETADNYDADATEDDGTCVPARDKFLGTYSCQEVCGPDNYTYNMTIATSSTGELKVIIQNLGDFATQVDAVATVSGSNITIDAASYNNVSFTGSGSINGNVLTLTYTATDNASGATLTCTITATKS
jgi:hypothetical protein